MHSLISCFFFSSLQLRLGQIHPDHLVSPPGKFYRVPPGSTSDVEDPLALVVVDLFFNEIAFSDRSLRKAFLIVSFRIVFEQCFVPLLHGVPSGETISEDPESKGTVEKTGRDSFVSQNQGLLF